jgi:putative NADPH-quinone reductase
MKILVITGSPHRHGTSDLLASQFIKGAQEAGHTVERFDAAFANLHPCLGCDKCMMAGTCCQKDDMQPMLSKLLEADLVALATPLYYFGMSTQLKMVIDRFYSVNGRIQSKRMDAVLLATAWDADTRIMEGLKLHYEILCDYLNWNNRGIIWGLGCGNVPMTKHTDYPEQAYRMGRAL